MGVLGFLKHKIKLASILVTREELKSVFALTVLEPPKGARYKIGDTIHTSGIGSALGNFKVYGIKAGGYGFAYIVLDEETLTPYCLKTFQDKSSDNSGAVEEFKREAETWLKLGKHPNLVFAHSVLRIAGRPHILFEYAAGSDLWRRIKQGPIPLKEVLKYAIQFCRGIAYAQKKLPGFVHGDVKPGNCLIALDQTLKVADFGQVDFGDDLSGLSEIPSSHKGLYANSSNSDTPPGRWRAGTPAYMAPEQFDPANKINTSSDVYSFGVMLFEMLTRKRPFIGKRHPECFLQHKTVLPPDPISLNAEIPNALSQLVLSCLAKAPAERPRDFDLIENELSALLWSLFRERVPPVEPEQLSDVELINRGLSLIALDRHDDALVYFDQLLTFNPRHARVWSHKGDVLSGLGRHNEALKCFDRALELDPKLNYAWANKGKALDQIGRYQQALMCFDQALAIDSHLAYVWDHRGHTLINQGRPTESLTSLKRALNLDPQCLEAHNNLGIALVALGRPEKAIQSLKRAVRLNQQDAEANYNLGNAYFQTGRFREAIEFLRQAIKIKREYPEAHSSLKNVYRDFCSSARQLIGEGSVETLIAFLLAKQSDPDAEVSTATDYLRASNFDPEMFYLCAGKIFQALPRIRSDPKEALTGVLPAMRKSIAEEPNQLDLYWLGKIYYGLGLYDECLEVFQQSISLFGPDDRACYFVAACNEIRGEHQKALEHYREALTLDPGCLLTAAGIKRMEGRLTAAPIISTLVQ